MQSLLKIFTAGILSLSITALYADNFVSPKPPKKHASISPLTPFDEALKREMQKYPKDSAFFIDGRTGKIISVNKLPKKLSKPALKPAPKHPHKVAPKPKKAPKIPYEMQEERIELLQ